VQADFSFYLDHPRGDLDEVRQGKLARSSQ